MKKLLSTSLLAIAICTLSLTASLAQHQTKLGAGLAYGGDVEAVGVQVNATFRIAPKVGLAPDFTIYFPDDYDFWALNFNGHYIFAADTEYHIYGLGGLNLSNISVDGLDESETELGINLGLGGEYHLDDFSLYGELKYILGDELVDQVALAFGVRFPI